MGENTVLESTNVLMEKPLYVSINQDAIGSLAKKYADSEMKIPAWEFENFLPGRSKEVIDYFMLANSVNFSFAHPVTKLKFSTEYNGKTYSGSSAMFACLKKAHEEGKPVLEGEYLKNISQNDMESIFNGVPILPMMITRTHIFREVGEVLCEKYDGHFYNVVEESDHRMFNNGKGIVERLVTEFPSFDDSAAYDGKEIRFYKRAQLAPSMLSGRFQNQGLCRFDDLDDVTIFADYVLPKGLRDLGVLEYSESLARKVDNQQSIEPFTREELEIRAATIHSCDMLIKEINKLRKDKINALHLDYKLWHESRKTPSYHHITETIHY